MKEFIKKLMGLEPKTINAFKLEIKDVYPHGTRVQVLKRYKDGEVKHAWKDLNLSVGDSIEIGSWDEPVDWKLSGKNEA